MEEAVELVAQDKAPKIVQPAEGATYDAFLNKVIYFDQKQQISHEK